MLERSRAFTQGPSSKIILPKSHFLSILHMCCTFPQMRRFRLKERESSTQRWRKLMCETHQVRRLVTEGFSRASPWEDSARSNCSTEVRTRWQIVRLAVL